MGQSTPPFPFSGIRNTAAQLSISLCTTHSLLLPPCRNRPRMAKQQQGPEWTMIIKRHTYRVDCQIVERASRKEHDFPDSGNELPPVLTLETLKLCKVPWRIRSQRLGFCVSIRRPAKRGQTRSPHSFLSVPLHAVPCVRCIVW